MSPKARARLILLAYTLACFFTLAIAWVVALFTTDNGPLWALLPIGATLAIYAHGGKRGVW